MNEELIMGQFIFPVLMLGMLGWMFFSQRKQQQSRANTLNQIKKGDEIVTIGGLYGIVDEINDQKVVLDIDGIYLTFDRAAIRNRVIEAAVTPEVETIVKESTEKSESAIEE
jgi:preprotein translocase subunit YajC